MQDLTNSKLRGSLNSETKLRLTRLLLKDGSYEANWSLKNKKLDLTDPFMYSIIFGGWKNPRDSIEMLVEKEHLYKRKEAFGTGCVVHHTIIFAFVCVHTVQYMYSTRNNIDVCNRIQ